MSSWRVVKVTLVVVGTLIAISIVLGIIALLVFIPLFSTNTNAAIMSEGVSGCGTIRSALRVYFSQNATYVGATLPSGGTAGTLQIGTQDLQGKYFKQSDYSLVSVGASTYSVKAGPPALTSKAQFTYIIDQNGSESGTYKTGDPR